MATYGWNFRILKTINAYQKITQQRKLVRNFFKNRIRNSAGALVILVILCFSNSCITLVSLAVYIRCKCLLFISFDRSSNFVEFARRRSLVNCSARLTTPHKNNMQQMVTKCYVLLGEKFGSFDWGFTDDRAFFYCAS